MMDDYKLLWGKGGKKSSYILYISRVAGVALLFSFSFSPVIPYVYANSEIIDGSESLSSEAVSTPVIAEQTSQNSETNEIANQAETILETSEDQASIETESTLSALSSETDYLDFNRYDVLKNNKLPEADIYTGALTYAVPITVPPGRNSMTPDLALTYNSQKIESSSLFGSGWGINIPFIKRLNKQGTEKLFESNTYYSSFDGELVSVGDNTFVPKSEKGSFRKYTFENNTWIITEKNGMAYIFGNASNSRQVNPLNSTEVFMWMLEEKRDANNNFIQYSYFKDAGAIYPDTIAYTGNSTSSGIFTVKFERELRSDVATSSYAGFEVVTKYRINEIRAEVSGDWVMKYNINYTVADNESTSLLYSVTQSGKDSSDNIITLPSETYTYQAGVDEWEEETDWNIPEPVCGNGGAVDNGVRFLDFNGDGFQDIFRSHYAGGIPPVTYNSSYINTGSSWVSASWTVPVLFSKYAHDAGGARIEDVNGDGLVDLLSSYYASPTSYGKSVYINNGNSFEFDTSWELPLFHVNGSIDSGVRYGDVNGDGLVDVVSNSEVYLHNGSGWQLDSNWSVPIGFVDSGGDYGTRLVDINNDGLADLINHQSSSSGLLPTTNLIYLNKGSSWELYATGTIPVAISRSGKDQGVRLFDINSDGLVDIVQSYLDGASQAKHVFLNTGRMTWVEDTSWTVPEFFYSSSGGCPGTILVDFNSDGVTDILKSHVNGTSTYSNKKKTQLLSAISYKGGATTSIEYNQTTQYKNGSNNYLNTQLPFVVNTVSRVTHDSGNGNPEETEFIYGGGEYYFGGPYDREFVGFATTTRIDAFGNVTKTYYHQGNESQTSLGEYQDHISKIGNPYRIEKYDDSENLYELTVNKWDRYSINATSSFVKLASTTELAYDGDSTHKDKAESYTYDDTIGNLTQKIEYGEVTANDDGSFSDTGNDKRTTDVSYASYDSAEMMDQSFTSVLSTNNVELPSSELTLKKTPNEVLGKRTYNSRTFDEGNDTYRLEVHTGHIFYKDDQGTFQPSDIRFEDKGNSWSMTKNNYNLYVAKNFTDPQLIRYDNKFEGAHHSIIYEPQSLAWYNPATGDTQVFRESQKVQGIRIGDNIIRYTDAFGPGIDFEVTLYRSGFKKEIVIRDNLGTLSTPPSSDYKLYALFEYTGKDIDIKKHSGVTWNKDSTFSALDGFTLSETANPIASSFIRPAYAVDSAIENPLHINLDVTWFSKNSSLIQAKEIPLDKLTEAIYPVRLDTMTSYYAGAGDGVIFSQSNTTWANVRNVGASVDYTGSPSECRIYYLSTNNYSGMSRSYFPFDTSGLSDATINSATVNIYVYSNLRSGNPYWDGATNLTTAIRTSPTTLQTSDYAIANHGSTKLSNTSVTYASRVVGAYEQYVLNASGIAAINKTGYTSLAYRQDGDIDNSAPDGTPYSYLIPQLHTSESAGTGQDPYLEVVFNRPPNIPTSLLTEGLTNPEQVAIQTPRFSAIYNDDIGDVSNKYKLQVSTSVDNWSSLMWDSATTSMASTSQGQRSPDITYAGTPLTASTTYYWRIAFVDQSNHISPWSTSTATFSISEEVATITPAIWFSVPKQETIKNQNNTTVSDVKYYFDEQTFGEVLKGNPTKTERWVSGDVWVNTQKQYNSNGLIIQEIDERGKNTTYTYDPYNLYVATSTNPLSQKIYNEYDYSSGKVATTTDANGFMFVKVYDALDRVIEEKQPDLTTPTTLVTKTAFEYTDTKSETKIKQTDYLDATTMVDTYQYFDGLGRLIQTRKEAEDANTFVVQDRIYGEHGQLKTESLPYFGTGSASTSATTNTNLLISYTHDPLLRPATVVNAVGTTSYAYNQWKTVVTDAEGITKDYYNDAYDRLVKVGEHDDEATYTTEYVYDSGNNLSKITDALLNIRNFVYDGLGRRTEAEDLHESSDSTFGVWRYAYDASGNVASTTNPNGQNVVYSYDDVNRVLTEDYTGKSGTEVVYVYDTCDSGIGKLCSVSTNDTETNYTYNPLGIANVETKTINDIEYITEYTHDRQGNQIIITYPDDAQVRNTYNGAGLLEKVEEKESGGAFVNIVDNIDYGPHSKLTFKDYANGTESVYTYDANALYRLGSIVTGLSSGMESMMSRVSDNSVLTDEFSTAFEEGFYGTTSLSEIFDFIPDAESTTTATTTESATSSVIDDIKNIPDVIESTTTATSTENELFTTPPSINEEQVSNVETLPKLVFETPQNEITSKRTYNSRTFDEGNDTYRLEVHTGHIFYKDDQGTFQPSDIRFEDKGNSWSMTKNNYNLYVAKNFTDPQLIRYDNKFEGAHHSIIYEPQSLAWYNPATGDTQVFRESQKVQGIRIGDNIIRYTDAFGPGIDFEVTLYRSGFKKEIVIRDNLGTLSTPPSSDYKLYALFEYTGKDIDIKKHSGVTWNKDSTFSALDGFTLSETANPIASSFIRPAYAVDSAIENPLHINLDVTWFSKNSSLIQAKEIPLDKLTEAIYPVRLDTMTSYYAGAGDGVIFSQSNTTWANVRNVGASVDYTGSPSECRIYYLSTNNYSGMSRSYFPFDTSGLSDATINSATVNIYVYSNLRSGNPYWDGATNLTTAIRTSPTTLQTSDYAIANHGSTKLSNTSVTYASRVVGAYEQYVLNASGIAAINKTGYTSLAYRQDGDIDNSAPDGTPYSYLIPQLHTSESAGTGQDPYLEVVFNRPPNIPTSLLTEGLTNPEQVAIQTPRFSAIYNDDIGDVSNKYKLQVSTSVDNWSSLMWDSATTSMASTSQGQRSPDITYAGTPLTASTTYYWRIAFVDQDGSASQWSTTTSFFRLVSFATPTAPTDLLTEGQVNPDTVLDISPEFSSIFNDSDFDNYATHYQIQVSTSSSTWDNLLWDSAKTALLATTSVGNRSEDISYGGDMLIPFTTYYWRIKFWDNTLLEGAWSTTTSSFVISDTDVLQALSFTYDKLGNITQIVDVSGNSSAKTVAYTYDDLSRLTRASTTQATSSPYLRSYTYNPLGNITSSDLGTYTYAGTGYTNPHAVTSVASSTYTYDNNGNQTSGGGLTNTWDYQNRITQTVNNGTTTYYTYDHTGARVEKGNGIATTTYVSKLYDVEGAKINKHIYSGDTLVATIETDGASTTTNYIHADHLGGTNVVTDEEGGMVQVLDYYPYGSIRIDDKTTEFTERSKFTGHELDEDTGLYYMKARYQNPEVGRFVSQDPAFLSLGTPGFEQKYNRTLEQHLKNPQYLNSYSYAVNNPLRMTDESGELPPLLIAMAVGALSGLVSQYVVDVTDNLADGKVMGEALTPSSPGFNYAVSGGAGAATLGMGSKFGAGYGALTAFYAALTQQAVMGEDQDVVDASFSAVSSLFGSTATHKIGQVPADWSLGRAMASEEFISLTGYAGLRLGSNLDKTARQTTRCSNCISINNTVNQSNDSGTQQESTYNQYAQRRGLKN